MNCRETCRHRELCKRYYPDFYGSEERNFFIECPMYDKFEDICMETRDMMNSEILPFMDDYDGPEDDELP